MNKKQIIWGKTLLVSYRYLEIMCEAIDKTIDGIASQSFYESPFTLQINSIHNVSKKIIDLSQSKINYINIKVLIEKILNDIDKDSAKLLILKYIHNIKNAEIQDLLKLTDRTFYRRLEKAIVKFTSFLGKYGFDLEKLEVRYLDDDLIGSIYHRVEKSMMTECSNAENLDVKINLLNNSNINLKFNFEV